MIYQPWYCIYTYRKSSLRYRITQSTLIFFVFFFLICLFGLFLSLFRKLNILEQKIKKSKTKQELNNIHQQIPKRQENAFQKSFYIGQTRLTIWWNGTRGWWLVAVSLEQFFNREIPNVHENNVRVRGLRNCMTNSKNYNIWSMDSNQAAKN